MSTLRSKTGALVQLFRVKPVLSWGVSALLLGAAVSLGTVGTDVNVLHGLIAAIGVLVAQGFVAHGFNDMYDWYSGTDKESIGKGTGGSRVIPQGKMSMLDTFLVALLGLAAVVAIGVYFYGVYGTPILALLGVAIWAPVAYSLPPLKLGYRPFSEFLVAVPAIMGVVVGTDLVLTGGLSVVALLVGYIHAMFCVSWFVVSRIPDYEPDKKVGKVTSVVYLGLKNARLLSAFYLALALVPIGHLVVEYGPHYLIPVAFAGGLYYELSRLDPYDPLVASITRIRMMHATTVHAVVLAVVIVVVGV